MAPKGDPRDRLAALEQRVYELERTSAHLGMLANIGEIRLIAVGITEAGLAPSGGAEGEVKLCNPIACNNPVVGPWSHTVKVKNLYPETVAAGSVCVIGQCNGIWILIAASC